MAIEFTKMHGAGNDYIYVNCMKSAPADPSELSRRLSPRHHSVGADGVILVLPSQIADCRMRIFNADGSEGEMCGNGVRCVAKFAYDNGIVPPEKRSVRVETGSGIKDIALIFGGAGNICGGVVDMGFASFDPASFRVGVPGDMTEYPIGDHRFTFVCMGVPHVVSFVEAPERIELEKIGPEIEFHPLFPQRTNVEFASVTAPDRIRLRVWERGSGITMACGTGGCAAVAAAVKLGLIEPERDVTVEYPGGDLIIRCGRDYRMTLTGEAVNVYRGIVD